MPTQHTRELEHIASYVIVQRVQGRITGVTLSNHELDFRDHDFGRWPKPAWRRVFTVWRVGIYQTRGHIWQQERTQSATGVARKEALKCLRASVRERNDMRMNAWAVSNLPTMLKRDNKSGEKAAFLPSWNGFRVLPPKCCPIVGTFFCEPLHHDSTRMSRISMFYAV